MLNTVTAATQHSDWIFISVRDRTKGKTRIFHLFLSKSKQWKMLIETLDGLRLIIWSLCVLRSVSLLPVERTCHRSRVQAEWNEMRETELKEDMKRVKTGRIHC